MPVRSHYQVERAVTPESVEEALQIRFDVFIKEQGIAPDRESDELDAVNSHWLVRDESGYPVATARMIDQGDGVGKIERIAVIKPCRNQGIGRMLLEQMERDAKTIGFERLLIHAQLYCQGFYEKLGYEVTDATLFFEEDIPHIKMEKPIQRG